jgi:Abortive infection C-terminus
MNQLLEQAETLQNMLVSQATGASEDDREYRELRQVFLSDRILESLVPRFFPSYAERREYLWDSFRPLLEHLEHGGARPSDQPVSAVLEGFDTAGVHAVWTKALDRRETDPEGAITTARTLLETVCKHILDELETTYEDGMDLPKLYRATVEALNLAPSQHTEPVFKQVLGGCIAVVEGLGSLRNRLSDAHGKGRAPVKPAARHAELAVNLAGTMASFLVATWEARRS